MKIGTMIFDIYGELKFTNAVEHFISSMDPVLHSVSDKFDSDYKRFGFYAAVIKFVIPLRIFWKSDVLYNTLLRNIDYSFDNWTVDIILTIQERRD
ncbi:hypothetical protein ES705_34332 [subsurface metagenome]